MIDNIMKGIRDNSPEKTITDSQYLNIMNFFNFEDLTIEDKRIINMCKKFNISCAYALPRSKYKEAMKYLNSGEWNHD